MMLYRADISGRTDRAENGGAVTRFYPAAMDLESDDSNLENVCAIELAEYKEVFDTIIDLDPGRLGMAGANHPVALPDEAVVALYCAGWHAGVHAAQWDTDESFQRKLERGAT